MSDKKNDDYGVQLRDLGRDPESGDGKIQTAYSRSPSPRGHSAGFDWSKIDNSPGASVLGYCLSSISMTVVNKYVVSGSSWNMNFLYLAIQVRQSRIFLVSFPSPPETCLLTNARNSPLSAWLPFRPANRLV